MLTYTEVTEPRWINAEKTMIQCKVKFDHLDRVLDFNASPDDSEPHGREIFERLIAGDFGAIGDYVPPPSNDSPIDPMEKLRAFLAANPDVAEMIHAG
ncbi:hypothetical protein N6G05_15980 [Cupriavidus gilardii]|uniref:Uncharacterized protein n=1 Tax=Cupriavidus gilardii TaxID=82541 RepID=A0ABY4VLM3_9BURK|nr:hypothetical protein [Cupriavidus gilardii]MCT9015068.1 hypothetical protein [Cupriavidus gilardii]MCT9054838.1 hypothetical protein [Cupriavidus gilardii]USE78052.1 hypothetical protein NDR89_03120 [Cupriavidus gilardii]